MPVRKVVEDIFFVGAIHWDRKLFDEIIPLPNGTSYNAYVVKGSNKIALIDTVDPEKEHELIRNLETIKIEKIDYIIANHAEQDHSGAIPAILEKFEMAKVVTNEKCREFLITHLHVDNERIIVVNDGEELSLGNKTLKFIFTPWTHWPETMVTYLKEDSILFSCDLFGSHLAMSDLIIKSDEKILEASKRYYAEIMMPFRRIIKKNLEKLSTLKIKMIAPSHGPIYGKPELIINAYEDWISDNTKAEVIVPYVSMHGSTKIMIEYFVDKIIENGMKVKVFNLSNSDIGELAMSLVDASTVVLGTPMILSGAHPKAIYAVYLMNMLRPKTKYISVIGSYGWGGRFVEEIKNMLKNMNAKFIDPVVVKGMPTKDDYEKIDSLVKKIVQLNKGVRRC